MEMSREFLGVWISREVWLDERLSMIEKGILTEIVSLDNEFGCTASNEYFAKFCQCSERTVSTSIKKLIELDYIYVESFNGRVRILRSRLEKIARQTRKNCKAESQNLHANNIYNKLDNNKKYIYKEKYKKETIVSDTKDTPHEWVTPDMVNWDETY